MSLYFGIVCAVQPSCLQCKHQALGGFFISTSSYTDIRQGWGHDWWWLGGRPAAQESSRALLFLWILSLVFSKPLQFSLFPWCSLFLLSHCKVAPLFYSFLPSPGEPTHTCIYQVGPGIYCHGRVLFMEANGRKSLTSSFTLWCVIISVLNRIRVFQW